MIIMPEGPVRVPHHKTPSSSWRSWPDMVAFGRMLAALQAVLHWQSTCCQELFSTSPEEACGFCKGHHFPGIEELGVSNVDERVCRIHQQRTLSQEWCPDIFLAVV